MALLLRRRTRGRHCGVVGPCLLFVLLLLVTAWGPKIVDIYSPPRWIPLADPLPPLADRVPCRGPRDELLSESWDDGLQEETLDIPYPAPFFGSHGDLELKTTWMTAGGRYGPYGYGEDEPTYERTRVAWDQVGWGQLQNECFARNAHRFPVAATEFDNEMRFTLRNSTRLPDVRRWHEFNSTRRTAILIRSHEDHEYTDGDMHFLRSLIVEASLRTGGEYTVVLLHELMDLDRNTFSSKEAYRRALKKAKVPAELRSITVLWDEDLLASWYPDTTDHRAMWQTYQPSQLFALHYHEFDHFWQLELGLRFTGDAGHYLDAVSRFARNEPRKQTLERIGFPHMQSEIGRYAQLTHAADAASHGAVHVWGPRRIPQLDAELGPAAPIGPKPPSRTPREDTLTWGVGDEADMVLAPSCTNAVHSALLREPQIPAGVKTAAAADGSAGSPESIADCTPGITRTSRALLLVMHEAQARQRRNGRGLSSAVASPITVALWHGLKISSPPQPVYWRECDDDETRRVLRSSGLAQSPDGVACMDQFYRSSGDGLSFWYASAWPRVIIDAWANIRKDEGDEENEEAEEAEVDKEVELPWVLARKDGQVYIANMIMHPVRH